MQVFCETEYQKEYYKKNKERLVAYRKEWSKQHHDILLERQRNKRLGNEEYKQYMKDYYANHKKELTEKNKIYVSNHAEKTKEYQTQYRLKNRDRLLEEKRLWHSENKERLRPIKREREIREWNSNPIFRLKKLMSHRIRVSLKSSKDGKCLQDVLGYSVDELRNHLESKFYNGMTWDNYGEWHIDHIKPISSFNFSSYSEDEFRKCWNLDNLQPLWARDNLSKGARLSA